MDNDSFQKTNVYSIETIKREEVIITLKEVYDALKERGYKVIGFSINGDDGATLKSELIEKRFN